MIDCSRLMVREKVSLSSRCYCSYTVIVAPRAGAWIETCGICDLRFSTMSRPVRARGLK